MKIRSLILAITFVCGSTALFAQKGEVNNAKAVYDKYSQLRGTSATAGKFGVATLTSAKASIDKAVVNEKTMTDPVAWTYKALIYADLAILDTIEATAAPLIAEAISAGAKAKELDKTGANKPNLETFESLIGQYYFDLGVRAYGKSRFAVAASAFEQGLTFLPGDTTVTYYAGLSYINAKQYDKAIEKYTSLTKTTFSEVPQVYLDLSKMYAMNKDTVSAIRLAAEGALKFPNKSDLATQEIELSMMSGKEREIIEKITALTVKEPKNRLYSFYLGIAYDAMKDFAKAEEAYKSAIAIDPVFEEAYINLGALMLNNGIDIYNQTNRLPPSQTTQYNEGIAKANVEFDKAFPYLEKATQINPKSRLALQSLLTYYRAKRNSAKADEIKKIIDAL